MNTSGTLEYPDKLSLPSPELRSSQDRPSPPKTGTDGEEQEDEQRADQLDARAPGQCHPKAMDDRNDRCGFRPMGGKVGGSSADGDTIEQCNAN